MKRCPFCAERIQTAAVVCRFCGRELKPVDESKRVVGPDTEDESVPPQAQPAAPTSGQPNVQAAAPGEVASGKPRRGGVLRVLKALGIVALLGFVILFAGAVLLVVMAPNSPTSSASGTTATPAPSDPVVASQETPAQAVAPTDKSSPEYGLALLDRGGPPDDLAVARFRSLLQQLSSKYVENAQQIADISVKGQELLRQNGIAESLREMMEGLNSVLGGPLGNQKYAQYMAMYVQLRDTGKSHDEAIKILRGALHELGAQ